MTKPSPPSSPSKTRGKHIRPSALNRNRTNQQSQLHHQPHQQSQPPTLASDTHPTNQSQQHENDSVVAPSASAQLQDNDMAISDGTSSGSFEVLPHHLAEVDDSSSPTGDHSSSATSHQLPCDLQSFSSSSSGTRNNNTLQQTDEPSVTFDAQHDETDDPASEVPDTAASSPISTQARTTLSIATPTYNASVSRGPPVLNTPPQLQQTAVSTSVIGDTIDLTDTASDDDTKKQGSRKRATRSRTSAAQGAPASTPPTRDNRAPEHSSPAVSLPRNYISTSDAVLQPPRPIYPAGTAFGLTLDDPEDRNWVHLATGQHGHPVGDWYEDLDGAMMRDFYWPHTNSTEPVYERDVVPSVFYGKRISFPTKRVFMNPARPDVYSEQQKSADYDERGDVHDTIALEHLSIDTQRSRKNSPARGTQSNRGRGRRRARQKTSTFTVAPPTSDGDKKPPPPPPPPPPPAPPAVA